MRRVATSWKIIEDVLREHFRTTYEALRPPASRGDLTALEDALGRKLPPALAASLRVHDGMTDREDLVDYVSLCPAARIASWWRLQSDYQREWQAGGDGVSRTHKVKNDARWRAGWIPFAEDLGGDLMVTDLDPAAAGTRGQVFQWYNYGSTPRRVTAPSLAAWFDAIAEQLLARNFTTDDMGTILLRRKLT
jgi:cell wall assembly regulator SMI1